MIWNPTEGIDLGFFMIRFYSLTWVVAFALGWYITKFIFERENESIEKLDNLFVYTIVATMIGARLGHVIFYQPELFTQDPLSVLLPFSTKPEFHFTGFSGLASHGAAIAIIITMYYNDHAPPHFHVRYGGQKAIVAIENLSVLHGRLTPRVLGLVTEWAALHREELTEDWNLARAQAALKAIAPLE